MTRQERRLELNSILTRLLGSNNVYYQPPENLKIKYPAIIYHSNGAKTYRADNGPYMVCQRYTMTYITPDPDDEMINTIAKCYELLGINYDRHYSKDGLNYEVYSFHF